MTQQDLNSAVACATGESLSEIRRRGFLKRHFSQLSCWRSQTKLLNGSGRRERTLCSKETKVSMCPRKIDL